MNFLRSIASLTIIIAVLTGPAALAQQKANLGDNAALRYWAAFAQMQDSAITDDDAKKLNLILDGTAPYDDLQYKDLVEKNRPALETMARGTTLPSCDWGLDYQMGSETPMDYVRKALVLGRLNVLYAFHVLIAGDKDKAVNVLAAGVRFSHDVANGGTIFATAVSTHLLFAQLRAMEYALHLGQLSDAQRSVLRNAVAQLGPDGLDWRSAIKRELDIPRGLDSQATSALAKIIPIYVGILSNPATLPDLRQMIASAPKQCADIIPNPERVLQTKQDLTGKLREVRSKLQ
jgi:hypothetical protein